MSRVYNFAAGPAMMPEEALERAAAEMLSYKGTGMSVMEMSHRSAMYQEIFDHTVNLLRVDSGNFAHGAFVEAQKYGNARVIASSRAESYARVPDVDAGAIDPDADYVYITTNNTIYGTRFTRLPDCGKVPLVADMSSNILSEPYDVRDFGVIFAGAQKNIGPAGLTVVVVRRDLLGHARPDTPKIFDWAKQAQAGSMLNTPATYAIDMAGLCLEWLKKEGGVRVIYMRNQVKAKLLYDFLDESRLFRGTAARESRSLMNVTFRTPSPETDAAFVKFAAAQGLVNLKGHRLVGGMRASIYNAMPVEGVTRLVEAMKQFEAEGIAR